MTAAVTLVNGSGKHTNGNAKGVNGGAATLLELRPSKEFSVTRVRLTPDMARELLQVNAENQRGLRKRQIEKIARDIVSGRWRFDGSPIRISKAGRMLDGQHRCHAVILAKRAIDVVIMRGIDDAAFETIDGGGARTSTDRLVTMGEGYAGRKSAAAYAILTLERELFNNYAPSFSEIAECLERHRTGIDWVVSSLPTKIEPGIPSGGSYVYGPMAWLYPVNPAKSAEMLAKYVTGDGLRSGDPVRTLRSAVASGFNLASKRDRTLRTLRAVEAYLLGEKLTMLKTDENVLARVKGWREKAGV